MHADKLDGEGAKINGGRWNEIGIPCIYTSFSRSLSLLEYTCHTKKHLIPRDLSFVTIEVPEHSIEIVKIGQLPGNWKYWPHPRETREFGTELLKANKSLLYGFPSVVVEEEMNYIINPLHPDMHMVKIVEIREYAFDLRLKTN